VVAGTITGVRYWRASNEPASGPRTVNIWPNTNAAVLATTTVPSDSGTGWRTIPHTTPLHVTPGTYFVSYSVPAGGFYVYRSAYVNPTPPPNLKWVYGRYTLAGPGLWPGTAASLNYFVDVEFIADTVWPVAGVDVVRPANVQTFTTPGVYTWTKPAGARRVTVRIQGPGGGGASGSKAAAGLTRVGGGGGASGTFQEVVFAAGDLPATVTVDVGAGGAGGVAPTADGASGNAGGATGAAKFSVYWSYGGGGGQGGIPSVTAVNGTGGAGGGGSLGVNNGGSAATTGGGVGGPPTTEIYNSPLGGGAGGGVTVANAASGGGVNWERFELNSYNSILPGAGGVVGGDGKGSNVTPPVYPLLMGVGGTGGGGGSGGNGGKGGDGVRGGGGGGGGACVNGFAPGDGGKGGDGFVQVITEF